MVKVIDTAVNSKVKEEFFNALDRGSDSENENWYAWNIGVAQMDTDVDIQNNLTVNSRFRLILRG
jgi:hypothetical protein